MPISALLPDIGGVLLTNRWGHHARESTAKKLGMDLAEKRGESGRAFRSGRPGCRPRHSSGRGTRVADQSDPHVDDLLDDLGELVEKMGGRVLVIPAERMPAHTGLAAIYRY
jgi:predicted NBD/HSP70 family sugar kinase